MDREEERPITIERPVTFAERGGKGLDDCIRIMWYIVTIKMSHR